MNEIALMEAASSVYKRKYQCPYCDEKYDRIKLVDHIEKKHSEFIPEGYTASRIVFNLVNKKEKGKCTICGKESPWDEDKCRYDRFCSDKCKKAYEQLAAERLKRVRGMTKQEMLKDPEYQNNVMLANRSISGKYKFQDGTIRTYVGSYEHKFLEFMDKFLNVKSEDLETPGPIIEYKFKGETHKWITDAYYAPYNLAFDIKDGGDNPNKREMPEYRAKQTAKEDAIRKQGKYNYIRLTDNKFEQLIELMLELKELYIENNGEYNPIIRINESTNLLESDNEMEVYRCTYKGEGIYEALRKNVDLETWKSILSSDKINWLPKPPQYKSDKNCRSYFTYKGYKKFSKDALPIMHKYLDKKYIKIDKLYIYDKPLYQDEYQIVISKGLDESTVLESKKAKDLGPKVCSKCGSKNIGVFFQGEPIYKCKDCGKYLGTVPFNESTSNDIIQNAFNSVIHTIKWCRMDDSAFCSIKEYSEPKIISDNSFSAGKFAYESGVDTVVKTINYNNIFENGKYSARCDNNELIITIDKLNNMNESYIIDKIYKGDNNMIHENSMKSNIDKDFKSKGKLSLSEFKRVTFDKSIIDKYKSNTKNLKHADPKDKGYAWIDKDANLVAYCTVDDSKDKNIWISALEVAKDYQGYGLSKQLLDVATKELKADALSVSINNKLAKRVYEKYGFKVSKDSEESVKKGKSIMYFMYIGNINESTILEQSLHKKIYFLSTENMNGKTLVPRIPSNYFTKNGYEDSKTTRVCFAPSIEKALMALSMKCEGQVFYVHIPEDGQNLDIYKPSTKEVPDSKITGEIWVKNRVKIKCIGKIINIKDKGGDGIKFKYGDKEAELYEWDYDFINEASNKSTLEELLSLNMKLNLFEYGLPVNGQITDVKSSKYWDENYKTMSTSEFERYKGGICWDYTFYQDYMLKKLGIQHTNYYIISSNYQTHTITVAKDSGKLYYIESSFKRICGVYQADNINDILFFVIKKMGIPDYYVFKINSFPKTHSTSNEYMQFMEDKGTLVMKGESDSVKDVKLDNIQKSFKFPKDERNINEGVMNIIYKKLYHGSNEKYDVLKPYGLDFGNAFQKPGFSLFTWTDKESAKGWAIFTIIGDICNKYNLGHTSGCNWSKQTVLENNLYNKVLDILPKLNKSLKTYYVYTLSTKPSYELGFGHSSNTKNCVTIRNSVIPDTVESFILTKDDIDKYCMIINSDNDYSDKDMLKMNGINGRFLTPFMTNDAMYNWKVYRAIKNGIKSGEIIVGDSESLNNYIKNNNIKIHHPSIKERIFGESNINESCKNTKESRKFITDVKNIKEYCVLQDKGYFKLLDKYKDPKDCSWDEEQTYPTIDACIRAEKCFGKDRYCYTMDIDTYTIHYIGKMHVYNFEDDGYSIDWLEITDDYPFPRDDINEACKNTEEARKFVTDVRKVAKKYDANFFIVTDGASGYHNGPNPNPAVKNARDQQIEWEKKNGFDPDEDWSKSIKEFSIITPSSDKPSQEGFIGRGSWNAIKRVDGEPYRERVEVIIFNKDLDKVLIGTKRSNGSVKLPGGGTDKNSSLESQAAKECQEEVKINIDNLKYIGSYSMPNKQTGYNDNVYKGQYTYLYLATYDSDYTGYIRPEDLDSLYDTAKWIGIYDAKELLKKKSVDLYNLFNFNYKLYINDLSYLKL